MGREVIKEVVDPSPADVSALVFEELRELRDKRDRAFARLELLTATVCERLIERVLRVTTFREWQIYIGRPR